MSSTIAASVAGAVVGGVVSNALNSGGGGGSTQQASQAADPFASQRPQYQTMLSNLMNGTMLPSSMPGYQFTFNQGMDALDAGSAKSGMLNSGNRLQELQTYGQQQAQTGYANAFSQLSQLAGANVGSPAAAGQIIAGQGVANSQAAGNIGNSVSTAITNWGNSPSTYTSASTTPTSSISGFDNSPYGDTSGNSFAYNVGSI